MTPSVINRVDSFINIKTVKSVEYLKLLVNPNVPPILRVHGSRGISPHRPIHHFFPDPAIFLAHEPVSATPPDAAYRYRKFAQRNKTALRAAAQLDSSFATQPDRQATLCAVLGKTCEDLGLPQKAIPFQEKARDYFLNSRAPGDADALAAMRGLGRSYYHADRRKEALALREAILAMSRRTLGPQHKEPSP